MRHRLEQRQAETLVQAGQRQHGCRTVKSAQRRLVDVAEIPNPRLCLDPLKCVAECPSRPSGDHELRYAGPIAEQEWDGLTSQVPVRSKEARIVLSRLDGSDRKDESRRETMRQWAWRREGRQS